MLMKSLFAASLVATLFGPASAAPLILENESVKVVVVRPIDLWSGNKSALESIVDIDAGRFKTFESKQGLRDHLQGIAASALKPC